MKRYIVDNNKQVDVIYLRFKSLGILLIYLSEIMKVLPEIQNLLGSSAPGALWLFWLPRYH